MIDQSSQDAQAAEITRLRERCALLDSLLGEALRHKYIDESACSPTWLAEAKNAVTDVEKFKGADFDPEA
jgi:hypothetical protein